MKTVIKITSGVLMIFMLFGCTKNFDKINEDPNYPTEVTTSSLMTAAQKGLCDDIYDEWWGGRQSMVWSEYWTQRNYTSEDRYAIRQNTNSGYWRLIYHDINNLQEIIRLNTNPETKAMAALEGDNTNQIACATILKIWAMQIMADTYGDIPYSEAFQGEGDEAILTPKYDNLQDLYNTFLTELKTAVNSIVIENGGFISGDVIYNGDMEKWQKFGNSLRLRVALRMSNSDNYAAANAILAEVGEDGLISSNAENADFAYLGATPNNSPMYDAYWTSARNDFTVAKPFINLLKGVDDTLNGKINPFSGLVDPRLEIYSRPKSGKYLGMPYGMPDAESQAYKSKCPSFYGAGAYDENYAIVVLNAKFPMPFFHYDEVQFMLSELNGWDQAHYIAGVRASIEFWRDLSIKLETNSWPQERIDEFNANYEAYITALPAASKTTVMAQKYLAFYVQGYQAWAEYRRTGEPQFLVKPGEITHQASDGTPIYFEPLVSINTVPWRLTYPQQEYTINATAVKAAADAIGGDKMSTKLFWQP